MPIVGGLDIHRKQITFDYLDTVTGEVKRGQIAPADRAHVRAWLARFAGCGDVAFAVEGCAGWRYVAGELAAAGITAHLGEPADTAALRGRKRRAKTDKTGARHLRTLLAEGRLPECWIPPEHIVEYRALLETYHDLRRAHTAQAQLRGVLPPGRPTAGRGSIAHRAGAGSAAGGRGRAPVGGRAAAGRHRLGHARRRRGPARPAAQAADPDRPASDRREGAGRAAVRGRPGHRAGADLLAGRQGPVLLLPQSGPVHRAGHHRALLGRKGPPGRLSRQGPPVLRWAVYEAGKTHARASAPDHGYYAAVADRKNTKRAALSEARKIVRQACHVLTELGDDALTTA